MPIFAYVLPVNAFAALSLCCAALISEGAGFNTTAQGLFGMYGSWHYLWRSLYLGAVPGLLPFLPLLAFLKIPLMMVLLALCFVHLLSKSLWWVIAKLTFCLRACRDCWTCVI